MGNVYLALSQYERAIDFHQQSLFIKREIQDPKGEAIALGNLGIAYHFLGQYKRAIDCYQQQLTIVRELQNRQGEANSLNGLGLAYFSLSQYERAIDFLQQSLSIFQEIQDRQGEAKSLNNLGQVYRCQGLYEKAIGYHQQSLSIKREIQDRQGEAYSLGSLGLAYNHFGQCERAIDFFQQSLSIFRETQNRQGEATSLNNSGLSYRHLGQYERAIDYHQQSLTIAQEIGDRLGEAYSLGNLGGAYNSLGEYERAIDCLQQQLAIAQEIGDRQAEANSQGNLGVAYSLLGEYKCAIDFLQRQLTIAQEIGDRQGEASSLGNLGNAYLELGQIEPAIQASQASLNVATPETMPNTCITAGRNLGRAAFTQSNWQLAITGYALAIEAIEIIRNFSLTDNRRQEILKDNLSEYSNIVQCYINLEQYDKALEYADRSRSRFLADLFHNKDLNLKGNTSPQVQEYLDLQQQLDRLRFDSPSDGIMGERASTPATAEAKLETIRQLAAKQQEVWETIRRDNKELAAQLQPTPLSFQQMQQLIPDSKTALLNFYSADDDTFIFILRHPDAVDNTNFPGLPEESPGSRSIACYTCKGEGYKTLQKSIWKTWLQPYIKIKVAEYFVAAQRLNRKSEDIESIEITDTAIFVALTDAPQEAITIDLQEFLQQTRQQRNQYREEWKQQMQPTLAQLAQRLQFKQLIDNHLQDIEELIIVPHLALHQIPFAALPISEAVGENPETTAPVPQAARETRNQAYRDFDLDISDSTPSPTTLISKECEYLSDLFQIRVVPSCQILDFCHQREPIHSQTAGIVENATGDLSFTPEECRKVAELFNVPQHRHLKREQATIANYLKLAGEVNILHSSHHAGSNLSNALESGLQLSDGKLDLANLFIQRFPQLSEVFLSCCETNFTVAEITDDVLTLAGGFLTAGARSVVSTLWSVQDDSTAEFCLLYYQLRNRGEIRPEALRKAQFELRKTEQFRHPYYWAAFVSQGVR